MKGAFVVFFFCICLKLMLILFDILGKSLPNFNILHCHDLKEGTSVTDSHLGDSQNETTITSITSLLQ